METQFGSAVIRQVGSGVGEPPCKGVTIFANKHV